MTLGELLEKIKKQDMINIQFWDDNMNMMRDIEENNMDRFIRNNGHIEVKYIEPINNKINIQIKNPNK